MRWLAVLTAVVLGALGVTSRENEAPKRVLLVTHGGGFVHDSVVVAEQVLKELGPKHGYRLTCYRFTNDPEAKVKVKRRLDGRDVDIETSAFEDYSERFRRRTGEVLKREQCGRVNAATLKQLDAVIFFTTSTWVPGRGTHPLMHEELKELMGWVRGGGGAFVGVHCATDTLHGTPYGELVGAFFDGHPWVQKVRLKAEDPKHPAARGLADGAEILDEIYQFWYTPYSRERLHIILSVDPASIDLAKGNRTNGVRNDRDYPVAWCQRYGQGRSFYTSLGHHKEVWQDPRFQEHLLGGLKWALGMAEGDATPSAQLKTR